MGDVLMDVESYLELGTYNKGVVDIIIVATAYTFYLNLSL